MDIEYRLDTLQEVKELLTQAANELEENDEYIIEIYSTIEEIEKEEEELQEKLDKIWEKEKKDQNKEFERSRIWKII